MSVLACVLHPQGRVHRGPSDPAARGVDAPHGRGWAFQGLCVCASARVRVCVCVSACVCVHVCASARVRVPVRASARGGVRAAMGA